MKLLVAVDLSAESEKVLAQARVLAKALSAQILLLHVTDKPVSMMEPMLTEYSAYSPDPQELRDLGAERLRQEHRVLLAKSQALQAEGLNSTALLVEGDPVATILAQVTEHGANMIIMGTEHKGWLDRMLIGSTSSGVTQRSPVPVLIVPVSV